jgi:hypothetical protein
MYVASAFSRTDARACRRAAANNSRCRTENFRSVPHHHGLRLRQVRTTLARLLR